MSTAKPYFKDGRTLVQIYEQAKKDGGKFYYFFLNVNQVTDSQIEALLEIMKKAVPGIKCNSRKGPKAYQILFSYDNPTSVDTEQKMFSDLFDNLYHVVEYSANKNAVVKGVQVSPSQFTKPTPAGPATAPKKTRGRPKKASAPVVSLVPSADISYIFTTSALGVDKTRVCKSRVNSTGYDFLYVDKDGSEHVINNFWSTTAYDNELVSGAVTVVNFFIGDMFANKKGGEITVINITNANPVKYTIKLSFPDGTVVENEVTEHLLLETLYGGGFEREMRGSLKPSTPAPAAPAPTTAKAGQQAAFAKARTIPDILKPGDTFLADNGSKKIVIVKTLTDTYSYEFHQTGEPAKINTKFKKDLVQALRDDGYEMMPTQLVVLKTTIPDNLEVGDTFVDENDNKVVIIGKKGISPYEGVIYLFTQSGRKPENTSSPENILVASLRQNGYQKVFHKATMVDIKNVQPGDQINIAGSAALEPQTLIVESTTLGTDGVLFIDAYVSTANDSTGPYTYGQDWFEPFINEGRVTITKAATTPATPGKPDGFETGEYFFNALLNVFKFKNVPSDKKGEVEIARKLNGTFDVLKVTYADALKAWGYSWEPLEFNIGDEFIDGTDRRVIITNIIDATNPTFYQIIYKVDSGKAVLIGEEASFYEFAEFLFKNEYRREKKGEPQTAGAALAPDQVVLTPVPPATPDDVKLGYYVVLNRAVSTESGKTVRGRVIKLTGKNYKLGTVDYLTYDYVNKVKTEIQGTSIAAIKRAIDNSMWVELVFRVGQKWEVSDLVYNIIEVNIQGAMLKMTIDGNGTSTQSISSESFKETLLSAGGRLVFPMGVFNYKGSISIDHVVDKTGWSITLRATMENDFYESGYKFVDTLIGADEAETSKNIEQDIKGFASGKNTSLQALQLARAIHAIKLENEMAPTSAAPAPKATDVIQVGNQVFRPGDFFITANTLLIPPNAARGRIVRIKEIRERDDMPGTDEVVYTYFDVVGKKFNNISIDAIRFSDQVIAREYRSLVFTESDRFLVTGVQWEVLHINPANGNIVLVEFENAVQTPKTHTFKELCEWLYGSGGQQVEFSDANDMLTSPGGSTLAAKHAAGVPVNTSAVEIEPGDLVSVQDDPTYRLRFISRNMGGKWDVEIRTQKEGTITPMNGFFDDKEIDEQFASGNWKKLVIESHDVFTNDDGITVKVLNFKGNEVYLHTKSDNNDDKKWVDINTFKQSIFNAGLIKSVVGLSPKTSVKASHNVSFDTPEITQLKKELSELVFIKSTISPTDFEEMVDISSDIQRTQKKINDLNATMMQERIGDVHIFDTLFEQSFNPLLNRYDDKVFKNTSEEILAPDGKISDLTGQMMDIVNSPQFIDWFGDWRNAYFYRDLENFGGLDVSRVLSDKFEPLVVWHGTGQQFSYFRFDRFPAAYFAANRAYSDFFARVHAKDGDNGYVLPFFLNIKNPLYLDFYGIENVKPKDFFDTMYLQTGLTPSQLDIHPLFLEKTAHAVPVWMYLRNSPKMLLKLNEMKVHDGIIFHENNPNIPVGDTAYQTKAFIIFEPNQAKLAEPDRGQLMLASLKSFMLEKGGPV